MIVMGGPAITYCTACPGKGLLSCELLAILAAAAAGVLLNVHNTRALQLVLWLLR
jgi:hypothetical protein